MRIESPSQRRVRRSRLELLEPRFVLDSTVVFNEVLYHAAAGDVQEWIELHNQMAVDMDLSGWGLRDAVRFDFPAGTVVPGGGYLVVAKDPVALIEATHLTNVLGPWDGRLDNGGERIQLVNNSQRVMDELDYSDGLPWPLGADGSGATLAKRHPGTATSDAANWTTSRQLGGTPGQPNSPTSEIERVSAALVSASTPAQFHVPTGGALADAWTRPTYVLGSRGETWSAAATSVGFENAATVSYAGTVLADRPLAYWRMGEMPDA